MGELPRQADDRGVAARWLAPHPRVAIVHAPTALERLDRLSHALDGPTVWVKRDDCTGLAGGGNKARKLEFLVGEALADAADTVITAGAVQSNHARQVAAAAARFGLRTILLLTETVTGRGDAYQNNGNLLLDRLLRAEIRRAGDVESAPVLARIAEEERAQGRRPCVIPVGGSNAVGTLGYVAGGLELLAQLGTLGVNATTVVHATGSGGTQAGLLLATRMAGAALDVLGISVGAPVERQRGRVLQALRAAAARIGMSDLHAVDAAVAVDDRFVGPGYGRPAAETIAAIRIAAETEGLLLDPVYSGKAMAGLIALIRAGRFRRGQHVVFLHTGGAQALGAYADDFAS